jgi:hypothetical protein
MPPRESASGHKQAPCLPEPEVRNGADSVGTKSSLRVTALGRLQKSDLNCGRSPLDAEPPASSHSRKLNTAIKIQRPKTPEGTDRDRVLENQATKLENQVNLGDLVWHLSD